MSRRDLSTLDRDIGQPWSRLIMEYFRDGSTGQVISDGGLKVGGSAQTEWAVSATQNYLLGTKLQKDSKVYRYAMSSTATALIAGKLLEGSAFGGYGSTASNEDCAIATGADAEAVSVTAAAIETTVAANRFAEGQYLVNSGDANEGAGHTYKINTNTASTGVGVVITYALEEAVKVAITTGATATITAHPLRGVIIAGTTAVGNIAGVAKVAVPVATPWCWIQTKGLAAVYISTGAAVAIGQGLYRGIITAGGVAVDNITTGADLLTEYIGRSQAAADADDFGLVELELE